MTNQVPVENKNPNTEQLVHIKDALSIQLSESSAFAKTILALAIAVLSASALAFKMIQGPLAQQYVLLIQLSYGLLILSILFAIVSILYILSSTSDFLLHLSAQKTPTEVMATTQQLIKKIRQFNMSTGLLFVLGLLTFAVYILLANQLF